MLQRWGQGQGNSRGEAGLRGPRCLKQLGAFEQLRRLGYRSRQGKGAEAYSQGKGGSKTGAGQGHTGADQTADRLQAAKSEMRRKDLFVPICLSIHPDTMELVPITQVSTSVNNYSERFRSL